MSLLPLFYQILVLFLILLIGFLIYRLKVIDDQMISGLTRLVMDVTLPAMVIISMNYDFSREILKESVEIFLLSLILYGVMWLLSMGVTKVLKSGPRPASVYQFMLIFPNTIFMGYPVIGAIYGKLGIFYASIFNLTFNLMAFTLGIWLFRRNEGQGLKLNWKLFLTPGIIGTLLGYLVFLTSFNIPYPIHRALELIGGMTTPISMLVVGALMGRTRIKEIWQNGQTYVIAFVRLIFIPLATLAVLRFIPMSPEMLGVTVVLMGMPSAANTAMFASRYGGDAELASRGVFITTLFSIVTIPAVVFLLKLV